MFELGMHCSTLAALRLNGIDPDFVGLDSLLTFRLLTALLAVVNNSPTALHPVPGNVTYTFQTIDGLADYVAHRLTRLSSPAHRANVPYVKWLYISRLFAAHAPDTKVVPSSVVGSTGSTGSLGKF